MRSGAISPPPDNHDHAIASQFQLVAAVFRRQACELFHRFDLTLPQHAMASLNTVYSPAPMTFNPQPWTGHFEHQVMAPPVPLGQFLQSTSPCKCSCQKPKKQTNIGSPISCTSTHSSAESASSSPPAPAAATASSTAAWPPVIPDGLAAGAQEVFFNTLMQSVKEANRFNSVKSSGWKNPMLYKTTLCDHWRNHGRCRFGVHCWYAHGENELRFVPRSPQLPTPDYIHQYLAYLGLPKNLVDSMINYSYQMACASIVAAPPAAATTEPTVIGAPSPPKPVKEFELERPASCGAIPTSAQSEVPTIDLPQASQFVHPSRSSGDDWDALNNILDHAFCSNFTNAPPTSTMNSPPKGSLFNKSFRIFGDSYPIKQLLFH
uniref:C3H1-type domain-containing protein n=1 Tax=Panagrellus redivivus TaxID=6233 RepID=A0A7E4URJ7_PANRE